MNRQRRTRARNQIPAARPVNFLHVRLYRWVYRWHTLRMHPNERHHRFVVGTPRAVARWGLLGAVISAVLAFNILTSEHPPGQHSSVGSHAATGHSVVLLHAGHSLQMSQGGVSDPIVDEPTAAEVMDGGLEHPDGSGELLLGCVLFLVVVGPAVLLAVLGARRAVGSPPEITRATSIESVEPAKPAMPRLALGVIRT